MYDRSLDLLSVSYVLIFLSIMIGASLSKLHTSEFGKTISAAVHSALAVWYMYMYFDH